MRRLSVTKNNYQSMLHTYLGRREAMRQKYGYEKGKYSPGYAEATYLMNLKIDTCRAAIKRFEIREEKIKAIAEHLYQFLGYRVRGSIHIKEANLSRQIFYKYCVEKGIPSRDIMKYVGGKQAHWATTARRVFNKTLAVNNEHREMYHRFSRYIAEQNKVTPMHTSSLKLLKAV